MSYEANDQKLTTENQRLTWSLVRIIKKMKRQLAILIYLCAFLLSCFGQIKRNHDLILLIDYFEYQSCEVLEVGGQKVSSKKYFCDEIYEDIDNFSEFFSTKKVFYFDGIIELSKNDIILFWNYNNKNLIDSLPFTYSNIQIDSIINDSILRIRLKNQTISLPPNKITSDTTTKIKREKNKLVKYTTTFRIENLGLIRKSDVIDNRNWEAKRFELRLDAPTFAEIMPEYKGGIKEFIEEITKEVSLVKYNDSKTHNTRLILELVIDENGQVAMIRIVRSINPDFDNQIIKTISNMPKWKPGMNAGKNTPVKITIPINFDFQ